MYYQKDQELILRDYLAIDRTILANERTLLAYIRTSLALILTGVSSIHFIENGLSTGIGIILILGGVVTMIIGLNRFNKVRKNLTKAYETAPSSH